MKEWEERSSSWSSRWAWVPGYLSTFVTLLQQGAILRAAAIALGTPALGVGAASAGLAIGRVLRDAKPR